MFKKSPFKSSHRKPASTAQNLKKKESSSGNIIQTKLTIGKANDKYEQEADRVADRVVQSPTSPDAVQRQCADCEQEEKMQLKPQLQKMEEEEVQPKIQKMEEEEAQPKLQLMEEEEAQPKLQRMEEEEAQPKLQLMEEEEAQPKLQRMEEEEPVQTKIQKAEEEELQTKSAQQGSQVAPANVHNQIQQSRGGGSPMAHTTRSQMETGIGADFSKVRIHTDSKAQDMSKQLNAQAFTVGNDVYFNKGKYNPDSYSGKHLLAHELTHTVQQGKSQMLQKQQPPANAPATPQSTVQQYTGTWGLDTSGLASHLYQLFQQSSSNLSFVFQVMDQVSPGNQDNVAYDLINSLSNTQLQTLAQSDEGRQLMARMRDYMDDGLVSGATQTEIDRINNAGSAVTSPSTTMGTKSLTVEALVYDGFTLSSSILQTAAINIFQQCAINIQFNSSTVNATDTLSDLGGDRVLGLKVSGSTSESTNVRARAGATGNTIVAALVEDIKVNNLTGFAGYTPGDGVVAISNRSRQTHTLAHEIGHQLGLEHVGDASRLMEEDNNQHSGALALTPWECSIMRSKL